MVRLRLMPARACAHAGTALMLAASLSGVLGCGRPITVQAMVQGSGDPIEAVRIYKYRFTIFSLLPSGKAVQTDAEGSAEVTVGPSNTNLTMLCQGFEPVLMAVMEKPTSAMSPDKGGYDYVLNYAALKDREVVPVEFRPTRRVPLDLTVVNTADGAPIAHADVYAATFVYLPKLGVEPDWGLPPAEVRVTDSAGRAKVDQVSGFRNRITVRKPGFEEGEVEIDGRSEVRREARTVALRPLAFKQINFLVVDAVTKKPIPGAEVHFGEVRDGLPPGPEVWVATVGADGMTGPKPVPDLLPCVMSASAKGYADWRGAPMWRVLDDGQVKRLELKRKQ